MCEQTVVDVAGRAWTGRLVNHLGGGRAEIDIDGVRHVGAKRPKLAERLNGYAVELPSIVARGVSRER